MPKTVSLILTSNFIKAFESIVVEKLNELMEMNQIINKRQHGFRAGRSCFPASMSPTACFRDQLRRCRYCRHYLDFYKSFDKVVHGVLLLKLRIMGIRGHLLRLMEWLFRDHAESKCYF